MFIECKDDVEEFVPEDEETTITCDAPVAMVTGGTGLVTVTPDPNLSISITGEPTTTEEFKYTATDANGRTAMCTTVLSILPGKAIDSYKIFPVAFVIRSW